MSEETITESPPPVRDPQGPSGAGLGPELHALMADGPVTRVGLPGDGGRAWQVTRSDDVRLVTGDPRFRREDGDRRVTRPGPRPAPARGTAGASEQPDHARLRRAVAFTADGAERVRERSRCMLAELVDELLQDGPPADLTAAVLGPFPVAVICELMGGPAADRQGVHAWTRQILSSPHGADAGLKARRELGAYFRVLVGRRGGGTGEDVTSLLGAAVGRGEVTLEEAVGFAVFLQTGGEAVTGLFGQMFHVLLPRPRLAERLRAEPEIRPRAVEELLRRLPHREPVGPARVAREDVEIRGVRIREGDTVHVSYPAAHRDPETIGLGRGPGPHVPFGFGPDAHVLFGFGPHLNPGGMPGRMAAELLVDALLDGVPGLRLAVPADEVPFRTGVPLCVPEALPVTW